MRLVLISGFLCLPAMLWGCSRADGGTAFEQWIDLTPGPGLEGWSISAASHHGDTQDWRFEDGAITGRQDRPGNGGVLLSDMSFGDFLLELEVNIDWGLDSGIFLRSTPEGRCYQVMVDYYDGGDIGGIYGEGIGGFIARTANYEEFYRRGEWNRMLILVKGNPPMIEVWLNGHHVMSWQGDARLLEDSGKIGLQVHAGERYHDMEVGFRNIRVRPLSPAG